MRIGKRALFLGVVLALAGLPLVAQRAGNRPRPSPNASVSQTVAVTEITVSYGRPGVKGREIWDELVPYGQLWRAGANEATTITFSQDVTIEGKKLAAGTYSLFTIPTENEWTVVLNKNPKLWGTREYDPAQDALRVSVKPQPAAHEEWLSFSFADLTDTSATLLLRWEKLAVPIRIQVPPAPPAPPRQPPQSAEDFEAKVQQAIDQAWAELNPFLKAGGKPEQENHPAKKWLAILWQYREEYPDSPAAARATREALHLLVHADLIELAYARADSLPLQDLSWWPLLDVLLEAVQKTGDYTYITRKAHAVLEQASENTAKARVHYALGKAYWRQEQLERAQAAFEAAIELAPGAPEAERARASLYELTRLNIGQPAPLFSAQAIDGTPLALAEFKGKAVLLNFWSIH